MIGKLGSWIREFTEDQAVSPAEDDEWAAAIAGLLIEAAMADGELDDRACAGRPILSAQPGLDATRVDGLSTRRGEPRDKGEIHSLTRAIRAETDPEDRAILEMAWMVVMSDGEVHEYEAQLMRRLPASLCR